jgi:hypothetical protein
VCDQIEWVLALRAGLPFAVLQIMDVDAQHSLVSIPALHDFVVDPLPTGGPSTDQHNNARSAGHLLCNPLRNGLVATARNRLPGVVGDCLIALYGPDVAHLRSAPVVRYVVETVENTTCHLGLAPLSFQRSSRPVYGGSVLRAISVETDAIERGASSRRWRGGGGSGGRRGHHGDKCRSGEGPATQA